MARRRFPAGLWSRRSVQWRGEAGESLLYGKSRNIGVVDRRQCDGVRRQCSSLLTALPSSASPLFFKIGGSERVKLPIVVGLWFAVAIGVYRLWLGLGRQGSGTDGTAAGLVHVACIQGLWELGFSAKEDRGRKSGGRGRHRRQAAMSSISTGSGGRRGGGRWRSARE